MEKDKKAEGRAKDEWLEEMTKTKDDRRSRNGKKNDTKLIMSHCYRLSE